MPQVVRFKLPNIVWIFLAWTAAGLFLFSRDFARRLELQASELKTQLMRAQLSALKVQLQPHFLFNTLNAVVTLVRQHEGRLAEDTLARLSDLLRWVLDDVDTQEVPLAREMEFLRLYLAIEHVRFQDRLQVAFSIDPSTLDAAVPHLSLQPIVENCIRHGIEKSATAGRISIAANRVDRTLAIVVTDDGPGVAAENGADNRGIGLANTRARLAQLYGDRASLTIRAATDDTGGTVVTMVLPFHPAPIAGDQVEVHASEHADRGR